MSLRDTAINTFTFALLKFIGNGARFASREIIMQRFEICKQCKSFSGRKCQICGCGIKGKTSLLNKLAYPTEHCPLDYWLEVGKEIPIVETLIVETPIMEVHHARNVMSTEREAGIQVW